jgi:hypothetical protein
MKRAVAVIALICLGAFIVASKPDKATEHKQGRTQQEVGSTPAFDNTQNTPAHTQKADDDPPHWYTSLKRPEWWLVVVAFLTCFFIAWQSWEIRKSAKAALASVEAARVNSEVIMNSERSWVLGEVEELSIKDVLVYKAGGSEIVPVFCTLKNYGVRLVWIAAASFELRVVDSIASLPPEPEYGAYKPLGSEIPLLPESSGKYIRYPVTISVDEFGSVMAGRRQLYVWGFVRYRDIFGASRESRFCFHYFGNPPQFRYGGPPSYNQYT